MAEAASSRTALVRRARRINAELARLYPDARIELNFATPLELLVAAILSARSTDRLVNQVLPVLFGDDLDLLIRPLLSLIGPAVPDPDRAGAVLARRDLTLE